MSDIDYTRKFSVNYDKDQEIKMILSSVYSEDPTYITNHNNARTLIRQLDRDELLQVLLKSYLHEK